VIARERKNVEIWERRPGESARAYAAFCVYRDLGTGRSLNLAYGEWRRSQGCAGDAAKAAGYWAEWSSGFAWVARAEAYDGHLEALKRAARESALRRLEERRLDFELKNQDRLEARVEKAEAILDKADRAPITDVTQDKAEPDAAGKIQTVRVKVKGISFAGYARLMKAIDDAARQAIVGVRPVEDAGADAPAAGPATRGEFVWVKPADPDAPVPDVTSPEATPVDGSGGK
jgi:hypothetical protein